MEDRRPSPFPLRDEPIGAMLGRALDLTQRVAADELQLLSLDSQERAGALARRATWIGFGGVCLLLAWIAASAAAVVALEDRFSLETRLALLALFQACVGGGLVAVGLRARKART